jgi:hypothetical protein
MGIPLRAGRYAPWYYTTPVDTTQVPSDRAEELAELSASFAIVFCRERVHLPDRRFSSRGVCTLTRGVHSSFSPSWKVIRPISCGPPKAMEMRHVAWHG